MRILITGGCGFIGSHLVRHMVKKYPEYLIVNLDKLDTCATLRNVDEVKDHPNYSFVKGDITCADLLNYVFKTNEIDTVIHLAAQSHVDNSFGNSVTFTHNNVLGTHLLVEAARRANVSRFVHVSTDEVYGSCDSGRKNESSATNPTNPYAASKAAAESIVRGYMNAFDFPAIITRGNNVYGPGQYVEKLIPKFTMRLLQGRKCCIHGDGSNRRHFLHVLDTVLAFDLVLHRGTVGETYNIGSVDEFTNLEIAQKLVSLLKPTDACDEWVELVEDRPFNDTRYHLCFDRLLALGWAPTHTFDTALADVVKWYMETDIGTHWSEAAHNALQAHPSC